ncbi:protein Skeletor, isoforms B/C-like [Anneissia japonica]|uniref:protein Skeletor, isoforms B/C-like n=1 Tax=Anneissia japonica TaxID=1529436 RepID=UPI0014254F3E|nr:protein Skeletor, isoforms B/C-like [Anneissia japonica]
MISGTSSLHDDYMKMTPKTLFIRKLGILLAFSGVIGQEAVSYFGKKIGDFGQQSTPSYSIQGSVYAVDNNTLWFRGFSYNGNAPDAFFWIGSSNSPDDSGSLMTDETGSVDPLQEYTNQNLIIYLPLDGNIADYSWISVWSKNLSRSLAHLSIPTSFNPPTTRDLGSLGLSPLVHKTEADRVEILDTQTVKFYNLKYDGEGPAAYFWVGSGSPSRSGIRLPDETGRISITPTFVPASSISDKGEDITVRFDGDQTVFEYDYIGLWCEQARQNFGHVSIPNRRDLNIPPSLDTYEIPDNYDNCEELHDRLQVSWSLTEDTINIQLRGVVNINDYMAFGISGSESRTQMVNSDVIVAWFDGNVGRAQDYFFYGGWNLKQRGDKGELSEMGCSGGNGACPDVKVNGVNNVEGISASVLNGVTAIEYTRMLDTDDDLRDTVISASNVTQIVWAIGQINGDGLAVRHIERGGGTVMFGRNALRNCESLVDGSKEVNGWKELQLIGNSDTTEFTAVIGQSGGERGYTSITDNVGWGISWYINDMLIPKLTLKRGTKYTFKVFGGNDANQSASYHPFYITNDKGGGYATLTEMEKLNHVIYAGPVNGSLCELNDKNGDQSMTSTSAEGYRKTLEEKCLSPKEPATLTWTPDDNTPGTVYYQCYTHRFLGWKIDVVDVLPSSAVDNEKPNVVCPDDIVLGTITTQTLATWSELTVNDNVDTGLLATCTPSSGTSFNVGSTKVTCFAIDVAGNEANCTFRVYVIEDHKNPTLVCPANVDETTESNQATLTWTGPVVGDNLDSSLSASCSPSSGSSFYVGSTNVTCNAYDTAGNEGKCMFVINVIGVNNTSSVPGYLVIVVVIVCIFILVMFPAMFYCRSYYARKNERNINYDDVEIPKPKTSINAPGNTEEISMGNVNAVYENDAVKRRTRMNKPGYIDPKLLPLPRETNPEYEDLHTYIGMDSAYTNLKK